MTRFRTYLAASAVLGAFCAPVAAQNPYPYGYQQPQQAYPGYGYNQGTGNPVTDIIDSLLGNRYDVSDRQAIRQCANAAMAQAGQQNGGYGYNRGGMRVTSITDVQRRGSGLRVTGTMASGMGYRGSYEGQYGDGNGGQYGYQNRGYAGGAVSFRCNIAYNGAVTGIRIGRY
jgi:hypothetical protein